MLTNLFVPGTAHLRPLARELHKLGVLNLFAYSHAISTTPESMGLPNCKAINFPAKEYLTRGHLTLLGWRLSNALFPYYLAMWERGVLRHWKKAPVIHALLWGASRRLLARGKQEGSATLGLAANAHPKHFCTLLRDESDRLGIKEIRSYSTSHNAMMEELQYCDHIQVESAFARASFISQGFSANRIHILHPGQDLSRFYPASYEEQSAADMKFRVICVGQISLRKGQIHLLEAWRRLNCQDASLTLIGAVDEEIAKIVRRYSELFNYVRSVPNNEMRSKIIRASVMVVPSIEDGYALVIAEALASGVPVITTTNTGAADLIRNGVNGFVVPPSSPDAIAEKLELLYRSPDLRNHLARGARETISEIGAWSDRARDYADLYRRIAPEDWSVSKLHFAS